MVLSFQLPDDLQDQDIDISEHLRGDVEAHLERQSSDDKPSDEESSDKKTPHKPSGSKPSENSSSDKAQMQTSGQSKSKATVTRTKADPYDGLKGKMKNKSMFALPVDLIAS